PTSAVRQPAARPVRTSASVSPIIHERSRWRSSSAAAFRRGRGTLRGGVPSSLARRGPDPNLLLMLRHERRTIDLANPTGDSRVVELERAGARGSRDALGEA